MLLEFQNVCKAYGKLKALDDLSLRIDPGQVVAVVGENGAGKSTLLRCLAGLIGVSSGRILFDGRELRREDLELRRRIFILPDFPFLFEYHTPIQHVGMVARVYEAERPDLDAEVVEAFRDFDLLPIAERPLLSLSRGQVYKAALCGLLAVQPELWLLDEPFASGMDPHGLSAFRQRARLAVQRGATILFTTQIPEVVERFADSVCVITKGRLRLFERTAAMAQRGSVAAQLEALMNALRSE